MAGRRYEVAGRTVLITGAARGIGAEAARRLHAKGANVALVGLEPELLQQLAAELGDRAAWFEADVTDLAALERAVSGVIERFGGIDVAIANAGIHLHGALATAPVESVERVLEVNLMGVWRTDRAVLPELVKSKGYLLNISSLAAIANVPLLGPYATAKAGVDALSNCLRAELAQSGVGVGCAYFAFLDTDLVRGAYAQRSTEQALGALPRIIGRPRPLSIAIDAIEDGIERRAARVWAPRFVRVLYLLRGLIQPITELGTRRRKNVQEAIRLAAMEAHGERAEDPILGVAAAAKRD